MSKKYFVGTSVKLVDPISSMNGYAIGNLFFQPYKSPLDILGRTTSIMTDPLLLGCLPVFSLLVSGWELLQTIGALFKHDSTEAKKHIAQSGRALSRCCVVLLLAMISPLLNLIDLLGSAITSLKKAKPAQEDQPLPLHAAHLESEAAPAM